MVNDSMIRETVRSPLRKLSSHLPNFFRQILYFLHNMEKNTSRKAKKDAFIAVTFTPWTKLLFGMLNIFSELGLENKAIR
jgi:hypothetical protein